MFRHFDRYIGTISGYIYIYINLTSLKKKLSAAGYQSLAMSPRFDQRRPWHAARSKKHISDRDPPAAGTLKLADFPGCAPPVMFVGFESIVGVLIYLP